ncbi:MAG TPA: MarR family winged helix-turn-helix transcriptional regulator [Solirubrobacteraceae bacterium]|jgi:DNA-binding MarR family transcriptional regulator|nr:MarR family winged helix-turn-helix transcriptional regulator [Solirubrobacteraceae bacterium]
MRVAGESVLAELGLRARHLIALTLLREHGEIGQGPLADLLQLDRTNLVGLLNELEADGLVERRRSAEDRRRHDVTLTDTGRHTLAAAEFGLAAAEEHVLGALDPEQREALYVLLSEATAGHISGGCLRDSPAETEPQGLCGGR